MYVRLLLVFLLVTVCAGSWRVQAGASAVTLGYRAALIGSCFFLRGVSGASTQQEEVVGRGGGHEKADALP